MNFCSIEKCGKLAVARNLCQTHYMQRRRAGTLESASLNIVRRSGNCQIPGCLNPVSTSGLCNMHWKRVKIHGDPNANFTLRRQQGPCSVIGCGKAIEISHYCRMHYLRIKRTGSTERQKAQNGLWRIDVHGYKVGTRDGRRVYEHRYLVEKAIGKRLRWGVEIHHLNGDKIDNRPCNLVVCPDRAYHVLVAARQKTLGYAGPPPPESLTNSADAEPMQPVAAISTSEGE